LFWSSVSHWSHKCAGHKTRSLRAAIEKLTRDHPGFDRFPDAHVVGDKQADGVKAHCHDERNKLIRARRKGQAARGPERRGAVTKKQAAGFKKREAANRVAYQFWIRRLKLRGANAAALKRQE
jgi:hypothetical protein